MKAIGIRVSHIKRLYLMKYAFLTLTSGVIGFSLSLALKEPLMVNIRLSIGEYGNASIYNLFGIVGVFIVIIITLTYVSHILEQFRKMSATEAIRFGYPQTKGLATKAFQLSEKHYFSVNTIYAFNDVISRKKLYMTMFFVIVVSTF